MLQGTFGQLGVILIRESDEDEPTSTRFVAHALFVGGTALFAGLYGASIGGPIGFVIGVLAGVLGSLRILAG